jgi:hypothetical protein
MDAGEGQRSVREIQIQHIRLTPIIASHPLTTFSDQRGYNFNISALQENIKLLSALYSREGDRLLIASFI